MRVDNRPVALVSACLLGAACRYDGGSNPCPRLAAVAALAQLVPVCPEQLGGLPTPRAPAERVDGRVLTRDGADVTAAFHRGAEQARRLADFFGARYALLKARSPSCGAGAVYDGSFSGRLVPGDGVAARLLREAGLRVFTEEQLDPFIEALEREKHDTL